MSDEDVLRLYEKHWSQYKRMSTILNGSCNYVNRHWVQCGHNYGRTDVFEIDSVSYFECLLSLLHSHNFLAISTNMGKSFLQISNLTGNRWLLQHDQVST